MIEQVAIPLSGAGFFCAALYLFRLNALDRGQHRPQCIAAQALGFLAGCWIAGSSAVLPDFWQWANFWGCTVLLGHLGVTSIQWADNRPPAAAESRPMPLEGLHQ